MMVGRLLYIGELKNMENDLSIKFKKENIDITINILQPDLAHLIHQIVGNNLIVTKENIEICADNLEFDKEEFLEILLSVHEEFVQEIDEFYSNIQKNIKTYYSDEELSEMIIQKLKNNSEGK